jgi:hypothetical protein
LPPTILPPSPHHTTLPPIRGNYTVRLRTFTAAGAAYSAACNFQVPDFAQAPQNGSPDIEFLPNPEDESSHIIKLTGLNPDDQYTVLAIGGLFPDRWQIVGAASGEATYDDQLDQWSYTGDFSTDTLPITAYFAVIGQHDSSYYYFDAPFDIPTRTLTTPDVTASYNSTSGYSLSTNRYVFPIPSRCPRRNAA